MIKNTSSFTGEEKNTSIFSSDKSFLLKEDTYFLLLEDNNMIGIDYENSVIKNTSIFTLQTKS